MNDYREFETLFFETVRENIDVLESGHIFEVKELFGDEWSVIFPDPHTRRELGKIFKQGVKTGKIHNVKLVGLTSDRHDQYTKT
ncbi:MAG: DUF1413 domain-containing protein [Candidatus Brocadiales bacterium]|nr:DUF1413 domain-containing protein [Candidatus Brocadiales bacterium]